MKKLFLQTAALTAVEAPLSDEDRATIEAMLATCYKNVDKAVQKGILHQNTGARRKARCALAKAKLLVAKGAWKAEDMKPVKKNNLTPLLSASNNTASS